MASEAVPQTNYSQTLILDSLDLRSFRTPENCSSRMPLCTESRRAPRIYFNTQNANRVHECTYKGTHRLKARPGLRTVPSTSK